LDEKLKNVEFGVFSKPRQVFSTLGKWGCEGRANHLEAPRIKGCSQPWRLHSAAHQVSEFCAWSSALKKRDLVAIDPRARGGDSEKSNHGDF
jgi:hypothetical protein